MTDDPIKLYVVVMAILLCVLGFVAYASYQQAAAYEEALDRAPGHAEQLKDYAADVTALCNMLKQSNLGEGYKTRISKAAQYNGVEFASISEEPKPKRIGRKGKEIRFRVEFRRRGRGGPLTREQIAKFCRTVERDTRNILKTIEVNLSRHTGKGGFPAGSQEDVQDDRYTGSIIFGFRVVD